MQSLRTLIELLEDNNRIHIAVQDLSGILELAGASLPFESRIHSKRFCDAAKSTPEGYRCCLFCKRCANSLAAERAESFSGHCIYGLYETVMPLVIDGSVHAIIYVGGAVVDREYTEKCIDRASARTGVSRDELISLLDTCESLTERDRLYRIAEIVADYLRLIYERAPKRVGDEHWLVSAMKRHAEESSTADTSLMGLAALYNKNEKYIGRLFKREYGISFTEYCTRVRLSRAERMLRESDARVLDIAIECGYDNVSYFNRIFKQRYGESPTNYRNKTL